MPGRSTFRIPLGLLALAVILAGVVGLLSRRGETADPGPGVPTDCGPGQPGCGTDQAFAPPSAVPQVAADEVCTDAGYLCAEVDSSGSLALRRWIDFDGTLVVHVPVPPHADDRRYEAVQLQRAASAGIRAWNGQPFPILVDERGDRDPHIEVTWQRSLGGSQLGRTETSWSAGEGLQVRSLYLSSHQPFDPGRMMDARQIRLTAAHEMGHALGLPHSDEPRDVMYPTNTATSLSARDYRTLEALYDLDDGIEIVR